MCGVLAMDPAVIAKLFVGNTANAPLASLTEREHDVLALMAEGLSNAAIAKRLFLSEGAISKYTTAIFGKLEIGPDDDNNRRVLAVLTYLGASS